MYVCGRVYGGCSHRASVDSAGCARTSVALCKHHGTNEVGEKYKEVELHLSTQLGTNGEDKQPTVQETLVQPRYPWS